MLYLSIWARVFKGYLAEALLMLFMSCLFFFSLIQGDQFWANANKVLPQYQDEPYITIMVEAIVDEKQASELKQQISAIEDFTLLSKEQLHLQLYNKLKKQGLAFPDDLLNKEMTMIKVFLKNNVDQSTYSIVVERIRKYFAGYKTEISDVKILRKSLSHIESIDFLRKWSREIVILTIFFFWLLGVSFFYWRTYSLISLCQRFKYQGFIFEKFYGGSFLVIGFIVIALELLTKQRFSLAGLIQFLSFLLLFIVFMRVSNALKRYTF